MASPFASTSTAPEPSSRIGVPVVVVVDPLLPGGVAKKLPAPSVRMVVVEPEGKENGAVDPLMVVPAGGVIVTMPVLVFCTSTVNVEPGEAVSTAGTNGPFAI